VRFSRSEAAKERSLVCKIAPHFGQFIGRDSFPGGGGAGGYSAGAGAVEKAEQIIL
jgi:hypothetical protein